MDWDIDLLGDPIPEGFGKRGRPAHIPTLENRRKVIVLAAFDRSNEYIAAALSITPPTLRRYYFRELRARGEARPRLEGKMLSGLVDQIDKGNVSAIDKMYKRLDRHDLLTGAAPKTKREAVAPKKGKKQLANEHAAVAHKEVPEWSELLKTKH